MIIAGPTWVYHATKPAVIVKTQGELVALGAGWAETPAAFFNAPPPDAPVTPIPASPRRRREPTA